jgi:pyrroline-5-carboxylate reductase
MFEKTIGFVGGGRTVRIILEGWQRVGFNLPSVVVADVDNAALERLPKLEGRLIVVGSANAAAAGQDIVVIAVHPPAIVEVLSSIAGVLRSDAVVVSLAPKVTMSKMSAMLGGFTRLARMIPNAASLIGRGFNPIAFGKGLSGDARTSLKKLFSPLGELPDVAEEKLEAYAILTAMGPTYFWPQIAELIGLGQSFGLSPAEATVGVGTMLDGAMEMVEHSGLTADELLDLIPVKPLGELEPMFRDAYRTKLTAVMDKIRP